MQQTEAMLNSDCFILEIPPFEVYKMHISCVHDNTQIKTDVIGIKCSIKKSHFLKEFFTQLGNPMELDTQIRTFCPHWCHSFDWPGCLLKTSAWQQLLPSNCCHGVNQRFPTFDTGHTILYWFLHNYWCHNTVQNNPQSTLVPQPWLHHHGQQSPTGHYKRPAYSHLQMGG